MELVTELVALAFAAPLQLYRAPAGSAPSLLEASQKVRGPLFWAVLASGLIWGFYNAALAMVFSFGPDLVGSRGMTLAEVGSVTLLVLRCLAIMAPVAGHLADRSGRRLQLIAFGDLSFAAFVHFCATYDNPILFTIAIGLSSGVAVGAMVSLPSLILPPASRALGMGNFFPIYYACIAAGPAVAGQISEWASLAETFQFAAVLLVLTVGILPFYHFLTAQRPRRATCQGAKTKVN